LNNLDNFTDNETLIRLIRILSELTNNKEERTKLLTIVQDYSAITSVDDKSILLEVSKMNWHSILYSVVLDDKRCNALKQKAAEIILNDAFWSETLDSLTKDKLGLNNGLAGFSMSLLNEGKRIENQLEQESTLQLQTVLN
jgi:hypothetical protein